MTAQNGLALLWSQQAGEGARLPKSGGGALPWILAAVGAFVVAASLVWLCARRRPVGVVVSLSPQDEAQQRLKRLWDEDWAARDLKAFYGELTGVVRRYLERTMEIPALEQTTEESLRDLAARRSLPAEAAPRLRSVLESADLVKFAAFRPERSEVEEHFQRARSFVELRFGGVEK